MPIGPKPDLDSLASGLDPHLFRLFLRDLLAELGFREIRDFDGSGDGGRDLEGLEPGGKTCVIQLKHREAADAITSANEAGELPLALNRLGRTCGLFVTNGRLSAPAKRDLVNAYPGLSLGFMEGVDLLAALDRAPITMALWSSGSSLRHLRRRVSFGVVCRALPRDKGTFLDEMPPTVTPPDWDHILGQGSADAVSHKRAVLDYGDVEPFRPPSLLTISEGYLDALITSEVSIHGVWTIDQLPLVQETIARNIAAKWSNGADAPEVCAVRVGRPTVWAIEEGSGLKADLRGVTWIGTRGTALTEREALLGSLGLWQQPSWIQTYQEIRGLYYLLLPEVDVLCRLRYTTMTSRSDLGMALRKRAHFDHWWERSVFCLAPMAVPTDSEVDDPLAPHFSIKFGEAGWIVAWLHPRLQGNSVERIPYGDQRDGGHDPLHESVAEQRYLDAVRPRAAELKGRMLEPRAAYHAMCFATGGEAAPSVMWRTHDTGILLVYPQHVPSPIDPFSIESEYAVAYVLEGAAMADEVVSRCNRLSESTWRFRAVRNPPLENDRADTRFLAGSVDRSADDRIVLITVSRGDRRAVHLARKLGDDAETLPKVLEALEKEVGLARGTRCSRQWLRGWRVYYPPERPADGDEQLWFDASGQPTSGPSEPQQGR